MGNNVDISIRAQDQATNTINGIAASLNKLQTATGGVGQAAGVASPAFGEMSSGMSAAIAIGNMASVAIMAVSAAIASIPQRAIAATAMLQSMETGLIGLMAREAAVTSETGELADVMPYAMERAKGMVEELAKIAIVSPYQLQNVQNTYRQAMAFGFASDEALDFTQALLNVAAGVGANNETLERMGYNLAQIRMVGKVTAIDFRQLAMAGFDLNGVLRSMGKDFGYTIKDYKDFNKLLEEGKLSWADFTSSFKAYAENQFGGASDRMARTLMGLQSTFNDLFVLTMPKVLMKSVELVTEEMNVILNEFLKIRDSGLLEEWGEKLGAVTKDAIGSIKEFVLSLKGIAEAGKNAFGWISEHADALKMAAAAFLAFKAVDTVIAGVIVLEKAIAAVNVAQAISNGLILIWSKLMPTAAAAAGVHTAATAAQAAATLALAAAQKEVLLVSATGAPLLVAETAAAITGVGAMAAGATAAVETLAMWLTGGFLPAIGIIGGVAIALNAMSVSTKDAVVSQKELRDKLERIRWLPEGEELFMKQVALDNLWRVGVIGIREYRDGLNLLAIQYGKVAQMAGIAYEQMAIVQDLANGGAGLVGMGGNTGQGYAFMRAEYKTPEEKQVARWGAYNVGATAWQPTQYDINRKTIQDLFNQVYGKEIGLEGKPMGMPDAVWKATIASNDKLQEIVDVQAWLKANPGDKVAQEYLKGLLGATTAMATTLEGSLAAAFPSLGAAQGWMGAFAEQHGGRAPGVVDIRDQQASLLFQQKYGRGPTEEEWQKRYYKGSFEGIDESGLDAVFGKPGTWKVLLEGEAETTNKQTAAIEAAFVALGKGTMTTAFAKAQEVIVTNFPGATPPPPPPPPEGSTGSGYRSGYPPAIIPPYVPPPNQPQEAYGDFFSRATNVIVGEAGPEVILPLSKPERASQLLSRAFQYAPSIMKGLPMPMAQGGMMGNGAMPLRLSAPSPVNVTIAGGTFLGTEAEAQAFARKIKKYLDREGARTL